MANSPLSYREAISAVLKEVRPRFEVFTTEPENLDKEFIRLFPHFVVCNQASPIVERVALAWVELYPDYAHESLVSLGGERTLYPDLDFDTLLSVFDEAKRLYENI